MPDFEKRPWRSRFEAKLLDAGAADVDAQYGDRKRDAIGAMRGTVVEIGPGTGANMRYYADGVKVLAVEPNPYMHDRLREEAAAHDVDLEIRSLRGESIDVADATAGGVVGTLLLCGVEDPAAVVAEAHRVLAADGTYFFIEHIRAPAGTTMRRVQRLMRRPQAWLFNGCRSDQETEAILRAGPFETVEIDDVDRGVAGLWCRHQIVGTATKAA